MEPWFSGHCIIGSPRWSAVVRTKRGKQRIWGMDVTSTHAQYCVCMYIHSSWWVDLVWRCRTIVRTTSGVTSFLDPNGPRRCFKIFSWHDSCRSTCSRQLLNLINVWIGGSRSFPLSEGSEKNSNQLICLFVCRCWSIWFTAMIETTGLFGHNQSSRLQADALLGAPLPFFCHDSNVTCVRVIHGLKRRLLYIGEWLWFFCGC